MMFRTAATKIAHNTTLPALAGHSDLRALQDLITAEKTVLTSVQRLGNDLAKASDALRSWGIGEGDDLGDILSASTTILSNFCHALAQYATHEHAIRDHMKTIRTREEALDDLKRRRRTVGGKADAAERKLSKMSPEHKNLAMQTDTLNKLRDEMRTMDSDIMTEEALLGDFKRSTTRSMMGLKFGGLLELCEKGTIIGEYGKLIAAEIPETNTQPGMSRTMYQGHQNVESLVSEAYKCVNEVAFSTIPSRPMERPPFEQTTMSPPSASYDLPRSQNADAGSFLGSPAGFGMGHFLDPSDITSQSDTASPSHNTFPSSTYNNNFPASPHSQHPSSSGPANPHTDTRGVDDFGVAQQSSDMNGGKFATFPVKAPSRGFALRDDPPMITSNAEPDDSFASSIEAALNSPKEAHGRHNEPAPSYEASSHSHPYSVPMGPPPGAAPPVQPGETNPWRASVAHSGEVELAYVANLESDAAQPGHARLTQGGVVRFGSVRDIDTEMDKRQLDEGEEDQKEHSRSHQVAPPTQSPEQDARELNAAAAREVSRELDALSFSPPAGPTPRVVPPEIEHGSSTYTSPPIGREPPSPLAPPSAPFHRALPSIITQTASPTAAQSYAQSHRHSGSLPQDDGPTSSLAESRALPSPYENRVPSSPVLDARPQPPSLGFADRSTSSFGANSAYKTPPEFPAPRPPFGAGLRSASSTSVNSLGSSTQSPGARTISAAAFRRPPPRMASNGSGDFNQGPADTTPLSLKKRLPSSQYPPSVGARVPSSNLGAELPTSPGPPEHGRQSAKSDDDDYDYIGAYTDNGNAAQTQQRPSGYGQGQFATDLETQALR